jgi:hypothetical protein
MQVFVKKGQVKRHFETHGWDNIKMVPRNVGYENAVLIEVLLTDIQMGSLVNIVNIWGTQNQEIS